jgi:hypothetical protein
VFDLVLDRVLVYPKEEPYRRRKAELHRIRVIWR